MVGVVPYLRIHVDDEDSLTERFERSQKPALVDIAVLRFPRISNFTDFNPLEYIEGVSLRYVGSVAELGDPDLIILPGTKNTMADLLWMRQCGLEASVLKHAAKGKPVFGVCGGYQMLGMTLKDPYGVEHGGEMAGLGLLDMDTIFERAKTRTQISGNLPALDGIFSSLSGLPYTGYEIHMGQSGREEKVVQSGNVYGSYLHGLFDQDGISKAIVEALLRAKGWTPPQCRALIWNSIKINSMIDWQMRCGNRWIWSIFTASWRKGCLNE